MDLILTVKGIIRNTGVSYKCVRANSDQFGSKVAAHSKDFPSVLQSLIAINMVSCIFLIK